MLAAQKRSFCCPTLSSRYITPMPTLYQYLPRTDQFPFRSICGFYHDIARICGGRYIRCRTIPSYTNLKRPIYIKNVISVRTKTGIATKVLMVVMPAAILPSFMPTNTAGTVSVITKTTEINTRALGLSHFGPRGGLRLSVSGMSLLLLWGSPVTSAQS